MRYLAVCLALTLAACAAQADPAVHPPAPSVPTPAAAVERLLAASPGARHQAIPLDGSLAQIMGLKIATSGDGWEARARGFLGRWPVLPASATELHLVDVRSAAGRHSVMFRQTLGGLPVFERSAVVTMNDAGEVVTLTSSLIKIEQLKRGALDEQAARLKAARAVFGDKADASVSQQAARVILAQPGLAEEAWMVSLEPAGPMLRPLVFISAATGQVLSVRDHSVR